MVAVRISRVHARSSAPTVRVTRLRAVAATIDPAPPPTTAALRVTRLRAVSSPPITGLQARAGADQQAQGFATVTLDGSTSIGATGLAWAQISGPAVTLGGSGGVRTFIAPTDPLGTTLVFQLAATSGLGTSVDTVSIAVYPWLHWRWDGIQAVPERALFFGTPGVPGGAPFVPPPPPPPMPTASFTSSVTGQKWTWIYGEDFLTNVALGGFDTVVTGSDLGRLDPATPGGAAYATSWKAKQAESLDTSGFGRYSAAKTMSVQDSVLRIWDHKEGTQAYGSAFKPLIPGADPNFLPYCRVEVRMRHTGVTGPGFGAVALLINNNNWPIWGEDDWPETQLGGAVGGFRHPAQSTNSSIPVTGGGRLMTDWHRYVIEWFPQGGGARVRYNVDDTNVFDSTTNVAVGPAVLGWLVQTASSGAGVVPNGSEGYVEIDWAAIWLWTA